MDSSLEEEIWNATRPICLNSLREAGVDVVPSGYGKRYTATREAGDFAGVFDGLIQRASE